uniref:Si:dkeyp-97e7.9 n=1 Tax=Oncorhynchus tshawytscha TaxID=74940 RepID=A0A8C8JEX6_ONCTS
MFKQVPLIQVTRGGQRSLLKKKLQLINCTLYLTATLRLHDGKLIKDRLYHLRTYPNYFLAQELTDWLNSHKEALDRATGNVKTFSGNVSSLISLVCDKYPMFKDAKLLYGFRKDDGIFLNTVKAQGVAYQRSIPGCQRQGLELCRALLEHGIIHPVVRCYLLTFGPLHCISVLECFASQVMGDAVGWGFVVRGMAPVYVQAVDPGSPAAAAAGVKVTQTYQVNWQSILHLDYCQVTRLVMTGPRTIVLEVMEPEVQLAMYVVKYALEIHPTYCVY